MRHAVVRGDEFKRDARALFVIQMPSSPSSARRTIKPTLSSLSMDAPNNSRGQRVAQPSRLARKVLIRSLGIPGMLMRPHRPREDTFSNKNGICRYTIRIASGAPLSTHSEFWLCWGEHRPPLPVRLGYAFPVPLWRRGLYGAETIATRTAIPACSSLSASSSEGRSAMR